MTPIYIYTYIYIYHPHTLMIVPEAFETGAIHCPALLDFLPFGDEFLGKFRGSENRDFCPGGNGKRSHFPALLDFLRFGDEFLGRF